MLWLERLRGLIERHDCLGFSTQGVCDVLAGQCDGRHCQRLLFGRPVDFFLLRGQRRMRD